MKNSTYHYLPKITRVSKLILSFWLLLLFITFNSQAQNETINVLMASTDNPPVIDGVLDPLEGWNLNQKMEKRILLGNYECTYITPGPASNNIVTWGAQWDANNLYIACKVVDDKITGNDLFEIFLGLGAKDKSGCPSNSSYYPPLYNGTDFQLQRLHKKRGFSSPQAAEGMVAASTWKDYADGYIVEVALSWEEMQYYVNNPPAVQAGYTISFDLSSSDADVEGADRTTVLRWSECCSDRDWTDDFKFGKLILSSEAATGVNEVKNLVSSVSLVPNPSNGTNVDLNIESSQAQNLNVSIMNVMSQTLSSSVQSISTGSNTIQLNTSGLSNGMYWVSISNGTSSIAKKLIVNK